MWLPEDFQGKRICQCCFAKFIYIVITEGLHTSLRSVSLLSFANEEDASIAFSRKNLENRTRSFFQLLVRQSNIYKKLTHILATLEKCTMYAPHVSEQCSS